MSRTFLFLVLVILIEWPPRIVSWPASALSPVDYDERPTTTEHNKDLYVVNAVVYEVGILTNATNSTDDDNSSDKGEQIAITLYHKNGSDIDFSKIPTPLYTNITGLTITGVMESPHFSSNDVLEKLTLQPEQKNRDSEDDTRTKRLVYHVDDETEDPEKETTEFYKDESESVEDFDCINKRSTFKDIDTTDDELRNPRNWEEKPANLQPMLQEDDKQWSVTQDVITLSPKTSINSIALPPLISLNANLSHIPIPIPNTSIVSYTSLSSHTKPIND